MKKLKLIALVLGGIAAVLYFASLADYAFPGPGARLMALWAGMNSADAGSYPFLSVVAGLFGGGNLIAPICGTLAVMAVFVLTSTFIGFRFKNDHDADEHRKIGIIAGFTAALVFMLTPAVCGAATHLEPRMFSFTWAALSFLLVLPYAKARKSALVYPVVMAVMAAFGVCDSALFVTLVPFQIAAICVVEVKASRRPIMPLFIYVIAGLIALFVALAMLEVSLTDTAKAIFKELKEYRTLSGWMFVTIFSTLPFVTSLFSSGKAFNEIPGVVQKIFHVAMSFVVILAIATPLSPSSLMEPYGVYPVVTSAFAAMTAGYLVAYWWFRRKAITSLVAGGILVFVLIVTTIWNLFSFDGSKGAFADKVADRIIADLGSRKWFITDGLIDDHLYLAAKRANKKINLIQLNRDLEHAYLDRLGEIVKAENVGGSKNGELCLSLSLGVLPFIQDWFASDPMVVKQVAIFGAPDLWYSAGISPVPELFFFGADETIVPDWSAWKEFDVLLNAPKGWGSYLSQKETDPVVRLRYSLRRHLGFVANDRGVYLQDKKLDDEAWKMYELVLDEIDHDNICSVFNEVAMASSKHKLAMAKKRELERMLQVIVEDKSRRYILWRLSSYYGYIRSPDIFIRLGHAWARSGRPGDALSQIRRAIDFVPTEKRAVLLNMMAMLYANDNDQARSRRIYETVLAKNANDHDALIGMMRLELLDGNSARAVEYLERAAKNSSDGRQAKIELAMVAMIKNDIKTARDLLKKAIDGDVNNVQTWSLLAAVTIQEIDAEKDPKVKAKLQKELETNILPMLERGSGDSEQRDYYMQATRGFLLLRQGEEKKREARDAFLAASKKRPDIQATQDLVLGLDIELDDKRGAEAHAREVLRRNRNAPLANYIMGSLAMSRGQNREAEMFLRRSADAQKPVALAMNDLAELLRRDKRYAEAETYARRAIKDAPGLYVAWETLASILMDQNIKLDEAESCVRKACELSKEKNGHMADIRMIVSLARVQMMNGNLQGAKVSIRKAGERVSELGEFEREEFEALRKKISSAR